MNDQVDNILGPAVIERAMRIYESFGERLHGEIVQARRALTQQIFGLIRTGEISDHRLAVSRLAYPKPRKHHAAKCRLDRR